MKYFMVTDEDDNGDKFAVVIEGDTPQAAFEKWFLDEHHGCKWEELEFDGLRDEFQKVTIYQIVGDPTELDFAAFVDKHDTRTEQEKDPEYEEYLRLKNKFNGGLSESQPARCVDCRPWPPNSPRIFSTAVSTLQIDCDQCVNLKNIGYEEW